MLALFSAFVFGVSVIDAKVNSLECDICKATINELDAFIQENSTVNEIDIVAEDICAIAIVNSECEAPKDSWQCKDVCYGVVHEYESEVIDIIVIHYLDPNLVCYDLGFDCPQPSPTPPPTPPIDTLVDDGDRDASGVGYFVHIPDVHWDPWYTAGAVENCGEPVCCRARDNDHEYDNPTYAGEFGSYALCDTSTNVMESMFDFMQQQVVKKYQDDLDFVMWVGDLPVHDVWNESQSKKLHMETDFVSMLDDTYGSAGVPVYGIIGNHEGFPINQFNGPGYEDWLYTSFGQFFSGWIDNEYVQKDTVLPSTMFQYGGFYTTLIRPGFRLIALHTGYMQSNNFYLLADGDPTRDMVGQLAWFKDVLSQARDLKEKVWVVQHYPVSGLDKNQQDQYYEIFYQFSDIIVSTFAGHSHSDEFHLLGSFPLNVSDSDDTTTPFSVQYMAGSVCTYGGRNPHFRLYSYDRATLEILDYTQYRFNISESNSVGKPIWFEGYSMKEEYQMSGMTPSDYFQMVEKMATNDDLFNKYVYNYRGGYDYGTLDRNGTICHLMTATHAEYEYCRTNMYTTSMEFEEWNQDMNAIFG